jgi:predicted negative regulator of RcsB-dependent stress response
MAVYDLEEQEQIDALKSWWSEHGNRIAGLVIAVCVAFIGVQGWRWYEANRLDTASVLYGAVADATRTDDAAKGKSAMAQLADRYAGTPYAPRAALVYAKLLWDSGDKAGARTQLQWALDHADDPELAAVARYRLAEAWLDDGKPDEALKLADAKVPDAFTGIYADLRGDALAVAGRKDDARKAYETALAKLDTRSAYRNYVEVKFHALGGDVAPTPAANAPGGGAAAARAAGAPAASASPSSASPAGAPAAAGGGAAPKP